MAKIARIFTVQKQMHRLAEWQLIELQRQEEELHEQARQLVLSLDGDGPLHGLFVDQMAKRLQSVDVATGAVGKAKETQTAHVVSELRKLRHLECLQEETARDATRHREKTLLDEVIDSAMVRRANAKPFPYAGDEV